MRIGFDAKRAFNNYTGLGNHARILLNAMMRDYPNNDYHLFTTKANEKLADELHGDYKIVLPQGRYQNTFKSLWRSSTIAKLYDEYKLDIYYGLSNELPWGKSKTSKTKTVVTIHDLIFLKHKEQYPFIDRQIYKAKTQYACKHADVIIATSNETKEDIIKYYGIAEKKIKVIYQSCSTAFDVIHTKEQLAAVRNKYNLPTEYILQVGAFYPRKNQLTVFKAFGQIANTTNAHLVFVGGQGDLSKEINELIIKENLQQQVHILSNAAQADMPSVYQNAKLFVYPSLFEGFGIPILEAMKSNVPVITTKGGCFEEVGGIAACYINPLDAEELAGQMKKILNNEVLRNEMKEKGKLQSTKFSDSAFAANTINIYKAL